MHIESSRVELIFFHKYDSAIRICIYIMKHVYIFSYSYILPSYNPMLKLLSGIVLKSQRNLPPIR